jgi:hypothetical protein
MAYHVVDRLSPSLIETALHTFLIRTPRRTIPSLYAMKPAYERFELGFEAQRALFDRIAQATGRAPLVIDGDDLLREPDKVVRRYCRAVDLPFHPNQLNWPAGVRSDWIGREAWHARAITTTGFSEASVHPHVVPDRVEDDIADSLPHYRYMQTFLARESVDYG